MSQPPSGGLREALPRLECFAFVLATLWRECACVEDQISQVSTDGAYDTKSCYEQIEQKEAKAIIPPRKNAKLQQHGNCKAPRLTGDENLSAIRQMSRKKRKRESGATLRIENPNCERAPREWLSSSLNCRNYAEASLQSAMGRCYRSSV